MQDNVISWEKPTLIFNTPPTKIETEQTSSDVDLLLKELDRLVPDPISEEEYNLLFKELDRLYPDPISDKDYDLLFKELDRLFPDPISEEEYDLLFKELDRLFPEVKNPDETRNYLFADGCKVYNQFIKKLTRYALKHKYVSGIDYKPKYQIKDEAYDLASNFLSEVVQKNKFAGYCEDGVKIGNVYVMFSQWMSRLRQRFGKQVDMRHDKRNRTLRDQERGDDPYVSSTPYAYGLDEVEEGVFEKEVYNPTQLTQHQELSLKMLVNEMQEIVRMSCRGDQRKHEIWSELLESYIEEKLYNIKRHSDKEWAEVLSISLKELRVHKASMRKALRNNVSQ